MTILASSVLTGIATILAGFSVVFGIEVVASLCSKMRNPVPVREQRPRLAVLIPAHDEALGITTTLTNLQTQLRSGDRLLVVADNCSDDTAKIAAAQGAEVSVRSDTTRIGKGFALDWGLLQLEQDPPEIVIVVDADCVLMPSAIERLASACAQTGRPVQALYLMTAPTGSSVNYQVAEFAWLLKNLVRPLGMMALGLPCQLMGSGMAFPWSVIRSVNLANGHIVEDMKLGLDLARSGRAPSFCPTAQVTSTFPVSAEGAKKQRQRWEHGQLALACTTAIPLVFKAIVKRNLGLLALALDVLVPPLSLFVFLLAVTMMASALLAILGHRLLPLAISAGCLIGFGLTVTLAWNAYGRSALPTQSLSLIPSYLVMKIRHYASALLTGRASQWVRTDRN